MTLNGVMAVIFCSSLNLVNTCVPTHNSVDLWRNLCTSLLYFVVLYVYDVVVKKVHVRYLISYEFLVLAFVMDKESDHLIFRDVDHSVFY